MEQENQALEIFNAPLHRDRASACAYLSYVIYQDIIDEEWTGQPKLCARKSDPEKNVLLIQPDEFDLVHWGIFTDDSTLYLCFRGSVTADDWLTNFSVKPFNDGLYSFHSGFYTAVHNAFSFIQRHVDHYLSNRKLIITGHSLGGALAQLYAFFYERHCTNEHIASMLECVITYAAPQSCNRTPPEHAALRDKCINYACSGDPVPMLPGIVANPHAGTITTNLAKDYSMLAPLFKARFNALLANAGQRQYLSDYRAFSHTLIIPNTVDDIMFFGPQAHRAFVSNSDGDLKISHHYMLFYLGEMYTSSLLSNAISIWFVKHNKKVKKGDEQHVVMYYDFGRVLLRVQRSWNELLHLIVQPAFVLRVLVPTSLRELVRHSIRYALGSEYYFIDANIDEDELESLLKLCKEQIGESNIRLYRPEDYSWIYAISDMDAFLSTFRPLSYAEQQYGGINEKRQRIRNMDDDLYTAVHQIRLNNERFPASLLALANELFSRKESMTKSQASNFDDIFSRACAEYTSVCAYLCYIIAQDRDLMEWAKAPRPLVNTLDVSEDHRRARGDKSLFNILRWGLYEHENCLYVCFEGPRSDSHLCMIANVTPLRVTFKGREYRLHCGFWAAAQSAYPLIMSEIQSLDRTYSKIIVTGHSYGGAFAQMFALALFHYCEEESSLECVITFGAPQTCLRTPPTHTEFGKRCINYCCADDPIPHLPGLLLKYMHNPSHSYPDWLLFLTLEKLNELIIKEYMPIGRSIILPSPNCGKVTDIPRHDYQDLSRRAVEENLTGLNCELKSMIFYIGELGINHLIYPSMEQWFTQLNDRHRSGEISSASQYYSAQFRKLCDVDRSWGKWMELIMRPAHVLIFEICCEQKEVDLLLSHDPLFRPVWGYNKFLRSGMYFFAIYIDAAAKNSNIMALKESILQVQGKTIEFNAENISLYKPRDYGWIAKVNNKIEFIRSFHLMESCEYARRENFRRSPKLYVESKDIERLLYGSEGVHMLLRALFDSEMEISEDDVRQLLHTLDTPNDTGLGTRMSSTVSSEAEELRDSDCDHSKKHEQSKDQSSSLLQSMRIKQLFTVEEGEEVECDSSYKNSNENTQLWRIGNSIRNVPEGTEKLFGSQIRSRVQQDTVVESLKRIENQLLVLPHLEERLKAVEYKSAMVSTLETHIASLIEAMKRSSSR